MIRLEGENKCESKETKDGNFNFSGYVSLGRDAVKSEIYIQFNSRLQLLIKLKSLKIQID